MEIRHASEADSDLIARLGAETFYETWRPVNTEEDMQEYLSKAFNNDVIRNDLKNISVNTFIIAFENENPIGYAKMRRDRTYDEFKGESAIEVERIYVKKEWQEKRAGKALMDECIRIAMEENHKWLWLGVNIDNVKAIRFYKKYGMEIFGEKNFQLGKANDNDYLMKMKLNG